MKKFLVFLLISAAFALDPISFKEKTKLHTDKLDQQYTYFSFDEKNPLEFNVSGDRRYKLILRSKTAILEQIEVQSFLDGKPLKKYSFGKELSRKTRLTETEHLVTKGYVVYFRIPKGKHSLTIKAEKELLATLYREPKIKTSIAPLSFADEDYLVIEDDEYEYYFTTPTSPAQFNLIGPITVTIYSRLSHFPELRGMQHYTITVNDNDEISNFHLESSPSSTGSYRNHSNIIPGKANKTTIKLSEGEHHLNIWGENVALKLYVPQNKLNNTK